MAKKRKKKRKNRNAHILPKIVLGAFVIYAGITLISLHGDINTQNDIGDAKEKEIAQEAAKKQQLTQLLEQEHDEEYLISKAQEEGYAMSNERVFIDTSSAGQ